jgi:hypothetical protein
MIWGARTFGSIMVGGSFLRGRKGGNLRPPEGRCCTKNDRVGGRGCLYSDKNMATFCGANCVTFRTHKTGVEWHLLDLVCNDIAQRRPGCAIFCLWSVDKQEVSCSPDGVCVRYFANDCIIFYKLGDRTKYQSNMRMRAYRISSQKT